LYFWQFLISRKKTTEQNYGDEQLIVVGAFDTTYRNSQVTYCSVGKYDGSQLSKVGEGLCNSALSKGMKITTTALAGPQDIYVAGSFHTQVWNGDRHEFVKIYNIAHYNAVAEVWLPLPVGQITCSWCTVTVTSLAWDPHRKQLHVAGKFNSIDGSNIPAGLALYDLDSGHLVAHPGGGLAMMNVTQDGVGTALQFDAESGVLYVMGSFERLTATGETCLGLAAYEIFANHWTCLAGAQHTVLPSGGGNMVLTPHGLMVAGLVTSSTTWEDTHKPYTIALLKTTLKKTSGVSNVVIDDDDDEHPKTEPAHDFNWSWLPGFDGHEEPIHTMSNGFGDHLGAVFIGGDNLVAKWYYEKKTITVPVASKGGTSTSGSSGNVIGRSRPTSATQHTEDKIVYVPVTVRLSDNSVQGSVMSIAQLMPARVKPLDRNRPGFIGYTIVVYCVALGALIGMFLALMCNKNLTATVFSVIFDRDAQRKGISLDTLTYSAVQNTSVAEAYQRAMKTRFVQHPHLLTLIDPQEIILHRIIGEGTFGRVWSGKWGSSGVAVKEFVFAQAAVAGRSSMQREIIEEIIGEAGMMAILRHPNVLQLFGCSLTAQAIWIVSELCSLGSLRQLLDDDERRIPRELRILLALQVAEGMAYLHHQDPPIIHRDLKSHNIFVHETFTETDRTERNKLRKKSIVKHDEDNQRDFSNGSSTREFKQEEEGKISSESTIIAKIGDWGSARATLSGSRTMTHGVGTACWLAPEVITHARSSKYSDVYSFGIVLWELATREEVYQGLETTQIIAKVANDNLRPPIPQDCLWKDVMVKCWAENPLDRLGFDDIVKELNEILAKARHLDEIQSRASVTEEDFTTSES
jgi:serine/threonine protein kinase